jgi:DNA (cytosine-5)-methyltransferase 1
VKPRLLDLFCGAGGAAKGYQRAGFYVVGIDLAPQPDYCGDEFIQAGALGSAYADARYVAEAFTAVHASPPCQAYTSMNRKHEQREARAAHPALIAETRKLLQATGLPYVIENVAGAVSELRNPIQLCGRSLGIGIHRHRLFETNFPVMAAPCTGGRDPFGVYGKLDGRRLWTRSDGSELRAAKTLEEAQEAMGMDWSDWDGLREAIPPVMTEHIGGYLLTHLKAQEVAA